jgi:hypothetical protein
MKNNRVFIPFVWIEFVIFTVLSNNQLTTGVNREYPWGRQLFIEAVVISVAIAFSFW